ncbi:flavodoxin family protein [Acidobacteriota bacterium]
MPHFLKKSTANPRKNSVSSALLKEIESNIASEHFVETVIIYKLNMNLCFGCLKCGPDKKCVLPEDDAHALVEKIKESDVLIIGSPVYWGNIPDSIFRETFLSIRS